MDWSSFAAGLAVLPALVVLAWLHNEAVIAWRRWSLVYWVRWTNYPGRDFVRFTHSDERNAVAVTFRAKQDRALVVVYAPWRRLSAAERAVARARLGSEDNPIPVPTRDEG